MPPELGSELFWSAFWPNFFSDLIVGVAIAGFITWLLRSWRRVDLRLLCRPQSVTENAADLKLSITNVGNTPLGPNDAYWHLLVPKGIEVERASWEPVGTVSSDYEYLHYRGNVEGPLYPERPWEILHLKLRFPPRGAFPIRYFISTSLGVFPKRYRRTAKRSKALEDLPVFSTVTSGEIQFNREKGSGVRASTDIDLQELVSRASDEHVR